jgi:transcriptional regulatory protein RtcR
MATLAGAGRIGVELVDEEIGRLRENWRAPARSGFEEEHLPRLLAEDRRSQLDLFDRAQLEFVIRVCRDSRTLSEAGRRLFGVTRERRKDNNDADRLRKYLLRFGLSWQALSAVR